MRNLRTQYGKEHGKMKSSKVSGTGSGDVYSPSWKWFTSLEFLHDSISPVKTRPTPGVPSVTIPEDDENGEVISQLYPADGSIVSIFGGEPDGEVAAGSTGTANKASKQIACRKKSPENLENEVLNKSLVLLENVNSRKRTPVAADDSDELFGQLVAQSLKGIDNKRCKEMTKLKIQQFLFEAQFGDCDAMQYNFQPNSTYYH